jgi:pimeloyl-ACP methyl ester carboxylesterase
MVSEDAAARSLRRDRRTVWWGRPLAEFRWQREAVALLADPVWRGSGVPRGDGSPVLLVPGFLTGDPSLSTLRYWLRRMGYRTYRADIPWNVECSDRAMTRLEARLDAVVERAGRPVQVVGHSRGGLFARALARRRPEHIAHVITLGSPLTDQEDCSVLTAMAVAGMQAAQHLWRPRSWRDGCLTGHCSRAFNADLVEPLASEVRLTSIYTRGDGIVRPAACRPHDATCIEVGGSHIGLGVNAEVYRHVAGLLAQRERHPELEVC